MAGWAIWIPGYVSVPVYPTLTAASVRQILEQLGLDHVRYAWSGAAPLPADVLSWFRSLGLETLEV